MLSHYFLEFYNNSNDSKFVDKDYYEQVLTYQKRSSSDQTAYMNCEEISVLKNSIIKPMVLLNAVGHKSQTNHFLKPLINGLAAAG